MPFKKTLHFHEAINFAKSRGVVLPDIYYGQVPNMARSFSFSVSGMETLGQIETVSDSLKTAITKGQSFNTWKKAVLDNKIPLNLPAYRKELIYRNFMQTTFNKGRCEKQKRDVKDRPVLLYIAVDDARSRESHAAMNGFMAYADDGVWSEWYPQNGHNCRCRVTALTLKQAIARGFNPDAPSVLPVNKNGVPVSPDSGWNYSVCSDVFKGQDQAIERSKSKVAPFIANRMDGYKPKRDYPNLGLLQQSGMGIASRFGKITDPVKLRASIKDHFKRANIKTKTTAKIKGLGSLAGHLNGLSRKLPDSWTISGDFLGTVRPVHGKYDYKFKGNKATLKGETKTEISMAYFRHLRLAHPELDDYFQQYYVNKNGQINFQPRKELLDLSTDLAGRAGAANLMPDVMATLFSGSKKELLALIQNEPDPYYLALGSLGL